MVMKTFLVVVSSVILFTGTPRPSWGTIGTPATSLLDDPIYWTTPEESREKIQRYRAERQRQIFHDSHRLIDRGRLTGMTWENLDQIEAEIFPPPARLDAPRSQTQQALGITVILIGLMTLLGVLLCAPWRRSYLGANAVDNDRTAALD